MNCSEKANLAQIGAINTRQGGTAGGNWTLLCDGSSLTACCQVKLKCQNYHVLVNKMSSFDRTTISSYYTLP